MFTWAILLMHDKHAIVLITISPCYTDQTNSRITNTVPS